MFMAYKAVIFDMDGLLLDSERIALDTFLEACRTFGFQPDRNIYMRCIGTNFSRVKEILMEGYGETFPYDDVFKLWTEKYTSEAFEKPVPLKDGAQELLKRIRSDRIPMAVATSTAYDKAVLKLKNAGILDFFKVIIAGDQVENSKPDPEIYRKAAEGLGVSAGDCLVFEDSNNGVRSAHAAGMEVVQIPDLVEPTDKTKALGHTILPSLLQVEDYMEIGKSD